MELDDSSLSSLNFSNHQNMDSKTKLIHIEPLNQEDSSVSLIKDLDSSVVSQKVDSLFQRDEKRKVMNTCKQNNFVEIKSPFVKDIFRKSTKSAFGEIKHRDNALHSRTVKFEVPDGSRGVLGVNKYQKEEKIQLTEQSEDNDLIKENHLEHEGSEEVFHFGERDEDISCRIDNSIDKRKNLPEYKESSLVFHNEESSDSLDKSNSKAQFIQKPVLSMIHKLNDYDFKYKKSPFLILKLDESSENNYSDLSSKFRKKFKRSSKRPIINKIAHQIKLKNMGNIFSAKGKFKIVFNKLRIILLFMYMIRRVKFYGLNVLRADIQKEIQKIERLKVFENLQKEFLKQKEESKNPKRVSILKKRNSQKVSKTNIERKSVIDMIVKKKEHFQCNFIKYLLINPESCFMQYWSTIMAILIIYTATIVPYRTSFNEPPELFSPWYIIELMADILFVMDFFINCFLGFYNEKNDLVMHWSEIILNYLSGWMILDFISIFPFQFVLPSADSNGLTESKARKIKATLSYITRIPRLFRLFKLFRIFRLLRLLNQNKALKNYVKLIKLTGSIKRIFSAIFIFIVFTHIFACLWFYTSKLQEFDPDTWVFRTGLLDSDSAIMYFASIYFTLSVTATLGYGDITAYTNTEKIMAITLMTFGSVFITTIISNLINALSNLDSKNFVQQDKIDILNKFAYRFKLKNSIYLKIRKSFEDNSLNDFLLDQNSLFKDLPYYLRIEIILHIQEKHIKDIFYFRDRNSNFVIEIIQNWKTVYFHKNDFIYFTDDLPKNIFFLIKGSVGYIDDKGNTLTNFRNGAILGEMEIILGDNKRFLNIRAEDNCEINIIDGEVFKRILIKFPAEFRYSLRIAKNKMEKYKILIAEFEIAGACDENVKKEIETFKTTSSYLYHLKKMKKHEVNVDLSVPLSDIDLEYSKSKSNLDSSYNSDGSSGRNSRRNSKSNRSQKSKSFLSFKTNQSLNNKLKNEGKSIINVPFRNTEINHLTAINQNLLSNRFNLNQNLPSNTPQKLESKNMLVSISGTVNHPLTEEANLTSIQNQAELRDNKIFVEWERRKLIELISTFDKYLEFIDLNYENLSSMKYETYELLNQSRTQIIRIDQLNKRMKRIERNQTDLETQIMN